MKKIFGLTGLLCMLLLSCNKDGLNNSGGDLSSMLSVTVTLDNVTTETATRASVDPVKDEQVVNTLYLYFFEASESQTGVFVDYIKVDGPLAMNSTYALQTLGTDVSVANAYNIVAVANIDKYISGDAGVWSAQWDGRTEANFRANAMAEISGVSSETDNSKAIDSGWILMSGSTTKKAMNGDVAVTLTRNLARFDVINSVNTEYDLMSVSIWNAYVRSSITGESVLDYSATLGSRTTRFYGVMNGNGAGTVSSEIKGGLYAFENKVSAPALGDKFTTCLIIGLSNKATSQTSYYRVNVNPNESAQNLKRNNAYKVTITGVKGVGAETEADAYAGTTSQLIFAINNWDLDDNGLIVSDMNSILAVPVKTVRIGAAGGEYSYTITTFSSLESPSPLTIKSQMYEPATGKINASLSGSTITINAQKLDLGEENRSGIITVAFAGLEASINVVQSSSIDTYLNVTLEDSWSATLGSIGGLSSEYIYVNASGAWTAQLFGDDGFSFDSNTGIAAKTTITSADVMSNKFHVYTHTANNDGATRNSFILISLNSDPVNYVSVVTIYQKPVGAITITPDTDVITFNGSGVLSSHPTSTVFTVKSVGGTITGFTLIGNDASKFNVVLPSGNQSATLNVTTAGINTTGNVYTATLRISDNSGGIEDITLRQTSQLLSIAPSAPGTVAVVGGQTDLITVSTGDSSSEWTATISTASATSGKTLYNHEASIVDENGDAIDLSQSHSVNKKFRVKFPKVYFPNREINITATITIKIAGSDQLQTITVNQTALTSKGVKIHNVKSDSWGNLNSAYILAYSNALKSMGYSWTTGNTSVSMAQACPNGTTYAHWANQGINSSYNWTNLQDFRTGTDGIVMLCCDANYIAGLNSASSPLSGYNLVHGLTPYGTTSGTIVSGVENSRIGKFLTTHGANVIANPSSVPGFYMDGVHSSAQNIPSTAVKIMQRPGGNTLMAIDPTNRTVYLGESQVFYNATYVPSGSLKQRFMYNFIEYVINAAKYGSHFTDLLNESLPAPLPPAMWDDVWGNNKWPDNK